ncbi:MAG: glycosyl hydrolase family 8 [Flavobacteriaceae bacterium]
MKKTLTTLKISIILIFITSFINAQNHPFPQNLKYAEGSIKPSNYTQLELNQHTALFYLDWQKKFLHNNECGDNQYFIRYRPTGEDITVSEAHGYGMMILAYFAGFDVFAKDKFDGMYNFYINHLAQTEQYPNSKLLSWRQTTGCNTRQKDLGTATDGDIDVAFALLLAHYQWGSEGRVNYKQTALDMINDIMRIEIHPEFNTILLGDWVDLKAKYGTGTRTSDFILDHFRSFENATGEKRWHKVLEKCYFIIEHLQENSSPKSGLLPDFVIDADTDNPKPPKGQYLENATGDGNYFYNACRDPWRIAVDYLVSGDERGKDACNKINEWIKSNTSKNPENIKSGYKLNGGNLTGNDYQSSAFFAPFVVSAMVDSKHQKWLNKTYETLINFENEEYYEGTIKMLSLLALSGNYWVPESFPNELNKTINTKKEVSFNLPKDPIQKGKLLTLQMKGIDKGEYTLELIDNTDQLIFTMDLKMIQNKKYTLNTSALPIGKYRVAFLAEKFSKEYEITIIDKK